MAYLSLGTSKQNDIDRLDYFKKAKELKRFASKGEQKLIDAYYSLMVDQDTNDFLEQMDDIVEEYPGDARIRAQFGYSIRNLDPHRGLEEVKKAVRIDPKFSFGHNLLGYLYLEHKDIENAEKAFREYLRLEPDVANPYDSLADMMLHTGRYEDAIDYYSKAVMIDSSFYLSQQKIGLSYIFLGNHEKGRIELEKAIDLAGSATEKLGLRYCYARSFCYEGRYLDALVALDKLDSLVNHFTGSSIPAQHLMAKSLICIFADMNKQAMSYLDSSVRLMKELEEQGVVTNELNDEVDFLNAYLGLKMNNWDEVNRVEKKFVQEHDDLLNLVKREENHQSANSMQGTAPVQIAMVPTIDFSSFRNEKELVNARLEASKARLNTLNGISAYYEKDYAEAKKRLLLVPKSELLRTYYLALTLDKLHEYKEAHTLFDGIVRQGKDSAIYSVIYYKAQKMRDEIITREISQ